MPRNNRFHPKETTAPSNCSCNFSSVTAAGTTFSLRLRGLRFLSKGGAGP
ncbi:MAG: hypothetical protein AAF960_28915 [Bacteroidota bacterium]